MKKNEPPKLPEEIVRHIREAYKIMTSNPEECIRISEEALTLSKKLNSVIGQGHSFMHIGLGYFHQGELAKAYEYYKHAEEIFIKENHLFGLRNVYNNLGVVYHCWQDNDKALHYYQKNLNLEKEWPDPFMNCNTLNNIGKTHYSAKDYKTATEFFKKSLKNARKIKNAYSESLSLELLGIMHLDLDQFEEGMKLIEQAITIRKKENNLTGLVNNYRIIANAYNQKEEYETALKYAEESLALAKKLNDQYSIAMILITIAQSYKQLGDRKLQKKNLELSLSYSEKEKYRSARTVALHELAKLSEEAGDFQQALEYYWQYQELKEYLTSEQKNRTIQQIRVQLKVQENERSMELIRKTNKQLEKKNRLINKQKKQLEKAEKKLIEWNHSLEERVKEEMEKRRQQEQFLIQKSKLESLGRLAAGIAHEINQPLGMLNIGIQNLMNKFHRGKISSEYLAKKNEYFKEHIDRIGKIIEHIRLFSRDQQNTVYEKVDIKEVISNVLSMLKMQCRNANIKIMTDCEGELFTLGNKYRLEQVLLNVLCNAKDALEDKFDTFDDTKTISIRSFQNQNKIRIEIEDNGCGISKQHFDHIFDPFYTTKSEQRGTGLGLSICYGILQDMHGKMDCESSEGIGTKMIVNLPTIYAKNESIKDAKS